MIFSKSYIFSQCHCYVNQIAKQIHLTYDGIVLDEFQPCTIRHLYPGIPKYLNVLHSICVSLDFPSSVIVFIYNYNLVEMGSDFVPTKVSPEVEGFRRPKRSQMKGNQTQSKLGNILPTESVGFTSMPKYNNRRGKAFKLYYLALQRLYYSIVG